jgi:hypothetical protein
VVFGWRRGASGVALEATLEGVFFTLLSIPVSPTSI